MTPQLTLDEHAVHISSCRYFCFCDVSLLYCCSHTHHTPHTANSPYTDPYDGATKQGPELALVPEVGKPSKVVITNVYAGKVSWQEEVDWLLRTVHVLHQICEPKPYTHQQRDTT